MNEHKIYRIDKSVSIYGFSGIYIIIAAAIIVTTIIIAMICLFSDVPITTMLVICSTFLTIGLCITYHLSMKHGRLLSKKTIRYKRYLI